MTRHVHVDRLVLSAIVTVCVGCGGGDADPGPDARPAGAGAPNILLIIADDFGLDMASFDGATPCYSVGDVGNDAPMPNVASLCARGVRFTRAWATPTCAPTRASMLTGQWSYQHGVTSPSGDTSNLSRDAYILPRAMTDAKTGYATGSIGKWHVSKRASDPNDMGWDHYAGSLKGALPAYDGWDRTVNGATDTAAGYATTVNVDDAIAWLDSVETGTPWLLWLAFNAPHTPYHVPPAALHEYDALPPYEAGMDALPYARAMTQAMDTELGRLFEHLRGAGRWDNTIVVFIGDNGSDVNVSDAPPHGLGRAKGSLYEGGVAVPLLVAGPGVTGPRAIDALVSAVDVFPTVLELAGADVQTTLSEHAPGVSLDARSFAGCLFDATKKCQGHDLLFSQYSSEAAPMSSGVSVRNDTHKLTCLESGTSRLFRLQDDPFERSDLYETDRATADALAADLQALTGDPSMCR